MHGYIHLLHREDQARLSLSVKLHVLVWENPSFVLSRKPGDEATRAIAEAQAEVAGARAPVCPSLATPLRGSEALDCHSWAAQVTGNEI